MMSTTTDSLTPPSPPPKDERGYWVSTLICGAGKLNALRLRLLSFLGKLTIKENCYFSLTSLPLCLVPAFWWLLLVSLF